MRGSTETSSRNAPVIIAIFLFGAYLFPYHVAPIPSFYNDSLAIFGVLLASIYWLTGQDRKLYVPWIAVVPVFLICIAFAQVVSGTLDYASEAVLAAGYLSVAALSIALGATYAARPQGADRLCLVLVAAFLSAALLSVAISALQLARAEIPFYPFVMLMKRGSASLRTHANLGQPNLLALLMCLALASVWWLYQCWRVSRVIASCAALVLLWGLAMTQSRTAWIILPLFALVSWHWGRHEKYRRVSGALALAGLFAYFVMAGFALPWVSDFMGTVTETLERRIAAGGSGRLVLYQQAWHMSLLHPWFGVGWGQFGPQQLMMAPDFSTTVYSRHAHNIVLNFAAEVGWPVTIGIFGILAYWLKRVFLLTVPNLNVAFAGLVFLAVGVHSMLEFPLWYAYFLLPVCLLIGMVHYERFKGPTVTPPRSGAAVVLALAFTATVATADDYRRVLNGYWALAMTSLDFPLDRELVEKPPVTVFPQMYDFFRYMSTELHDVRSEEDLKFMEKVAKQFGGAEVWMRLSQVYAANGRDEDAVRAMETIYRLHPGRYQHYFDQWQNSPDEYQVIFRRLPQP